MIMQSLLVILLSISWAYGEDRTCLRGHARVDFRDGAPVAFKARGRQQTCPNAEWGCGGARRFGRSILMDGDSVALPIDTQAWSSLDLRCLPPAVCDRIIGNDDADSGCRFVDYTWYRYNPKSCNRSAVPPYDADIYRQRTRMYFACCTSGDNCLKVADATQTNTALNDTCVSNERLANYISDLHLCWLAGRADFRQYFVCDTDGPDLVQYRKLCFDNEYGEWSRVRAANRTNSTRCFYRPTCSAALQTLISSFGECACEKAKAHGYDGSAIGSLMEYLWNDYCPGIEISCANQDTTLWLRRRLRRRKIRFKVARALAALTDDWKSVIREKIAEHLKIDEDSITVTVGDDSTTRRRLLADETQVEIDVVGSDGLDDAINAAACDETGVAAALSETISDLTCESADEYDTVSGENYTTTTTSTTSQTEDTESGNAMFYAAFAAVIALLCSLME
eukprot:327736_1